MVYDLDGSYTMAVDVDDHRSFLAAVGTFVAAAVFHPSGFSSSVEDGRDFLSPDSLLLR